MENKDSGGNELSIILLVLFCTFIYKVSPIVTQFYNQYKTVIFSFLIFVFASFLIILFLKVYKKLKIEKNKPKDIFIGHSEGKPTYISNAQRTTHTQVIGTTGSGKTESVILPSIIQDIEANRGVLIIDGKSDNDFLKKLYAYCIRCGREDDFKLFSLANRQTSHSFNPLSKGSSVEIAEKVFSAFDFENEYYKNIQYKIFLNIISLIKEKTDPTMKLIHRLLTNEKKLSSWLEECEDKDCKKILEGFCSLSSSQREERTSGLESQLAHFIQSDCHELFDETKNTISIDDALEKGQILYFQLPTMLYPFLGSVTGKLVLQSLQSAVSKRHLSGNKKGLFTVYLDDFQDYIYEGFGSLLNKSRSANVAMVFSHQSLGDLERVSQAFSDVVLTNTNLKIIMRVTDPKTCDYFAKYFGTKSSIKETEQTDKGFLGISKTGRGSLRKVEEYIFHPNLFKKIPVGSGLVSLPEIDGVKHKRICFPRIKPVQGVELKIIEKKPVKEIEDPPKVKQNVVDECEKILKKENAA